ncbi:MAG: tRNA (guanosine(37)-N1)-methyltransferase TrmD [Waddliaceae bacterium]
MQIDILSLFPDYFRGPFDESIIKRARAKGILDIRLIDIRDFADNPHRRVDDRPYGGGPGMVLKVGPVVRAIREVKTSASKVIYLSPQGKTLNAESCREIAQYEHLVLLCGHYEGVDERALMLEVDEELSIGDYVLTNGCAAAIVVVDAVARFIPGVIGNEKSVSEDSFEQGVLRSRPFTRPPVYEGMEVPEVLKSGNHQKIQEFRKSRSKKI